MEEKVETKLSNEEIIESLKIQLEQHKIMAIKAEGAIEVLQKMEVIYKRRFWTFFLPV